MPPQYPSLNNQILTHEEKMPSGVPQRFLAFSVFVFLLVVLGYFGMAYGYASFLRNEIDDRKAKLDELGRRISVDDQKELTRVYSQISNIEKLLPSHVLASRVFTFLEGNTARQVTYIGADLSVPDRRLALDGVAASYDELVRQLASYEKASEVERINLESSEAIGSVVRFKASLIMNPSIFKP